MAIFIVAGTFLPLVRYDHWMIRCWDFPRIQLFCVAVLTFVCLLFVSFNDAEHGLDLVILVAVGLAISALFFWLIPYTSLCKKEVFDGTGKTGIKILVSNVLMTNRDSDKLVAHIRRHEPDIVVALEIDQWWAGKLSETKDAYPHTVEIPQDDTYGMIMLSRLPLIDPQVERIIRDNIPSIHTGVELEDGTIVRLHALHPKPPFPDEDTTSTDRDAELLIVGKRTREAGGPTLVLGDMNDVAWSRTTRLFQKTSGLLDPRVGRGFFSTFHASHRLIRWPLDHVFISDHFRVRHLKRLSHVGSDHFPMFADFSYEPDGRAEQETPEANGDERSEAEDKISDAKT